MFLPEQKFLILDYETFSEIDLRKVGSYEYSKHPSTEILCASFRLGTVKTLQKAKVISWAPKRKWNKLRDDLRNGQKLARLISDPTIIKVAHNALFEQAITRNVLPKHLGKYLPKPFTIPHEQFFCTAVQAAVHALPRSLDGATAALGLDHQKDKEGHRLMLKWTKPKKSSLVDPSTRYIKNFDRLIEYCEKDIYAETDLFLSLPFLTSNERNLWLFDQKINFRGVRIDRDLIHKTLELIDKDKEEMIKELKELTKGAVHSAGQKKVLHNWFQTQGIVLPNLQAKTVVDTLKSEEISPKVRRVLELCQRLNKTSLKKYSVFLNHTTSDGILRFSLNFHAASTGRWGGAGAQPHNLPRPVLSNEEIEFAIKLIKDEI